MTIRLISISLRIGQQQPQTLSERSSRADVVEVVARVLVDPVAPAQEVLARARVAVCAVRALVRAPAPGFKKAFTE